MTEPVIAIATPANRERAVASLVAAFTGDPVLRYLFPDEATYAAYAAAFASADGLPTVLETSNAANVEVYRRAGWETMEAVSEPLPTWIMQQKPNGLSAQ